MTLKEITNKLRYEPLFQSQCEAMADQLEAIVAEAGKARHDELASEREAGWQAAKEAIIAALNAMQCEPASEYCGYLVVDMANVMATVRGVK